MLVYRCYSHRWMLDVFAPSAVGLLDGFVALLNRRQCSRRSWPRSRTDIPLSGPRCNGSCAPFPRLYRRCYSFLWLWLFAFGCHPLDPFNLLLLLLLRARLVPKEPLLPFASENKNSPVPRPNQPYLSAAWQHLAAKPARSSILIHSSRVQD